MRRYRARVREANPPREVENIYRVVRPGRSAAWEGRVQFGGVRHIITRSVKKHGSYQAYRAVERQVEKWREEAKAQHARWLAGEE
jgi:hypothetical protein